MGASPPPSTPIPCPACGTPGSGRFCSECGAVLQGALCAACHSILTPGAKFCHHCGTAAGTSVPPAGAILSPVRVPLESAGGSRLPWVFAGLAVVALLVILIAQRSATSGPPADSGAATGQVPSAGSGVVAATDISSMSPRERATRLFNRVMKAADEGKQDTVAFFAPMALSSFESLGPMDADLHFDYGRVAEVSGNLDLAGAQADSILKKTPTHLLGLILAAKVAERRGDLKRRNALEKQLLSAQATELKKSLDEYTAHRLEIEAAISAASSRKP
jgi:double zinc ribbon protein